MLTGGGSSLRGRGGRTISGARFGVFALLIGLTALAPNLVSAGGLGTTDIGPRRNGMFAVTARPDDTTAIVHNPAGLADQRGNRVHLSGMAGFLSQEAELMCEEWMERYDLQEECSGRDYSRPISPETNYSVAPFLGLSMDLDALVENLVIGAALYATNLRGSVMDEFSLARFHGIQSRLLSGLVTGAVSYRPSRYLALGLGASYVHLTAESWRRIVFFGEEWDLKLEGRDTSMQLHFGLLLEPASWVSFGLGFDTETALLPAGEVRLAGVDHYDYDHHQTNFYVLRQETTVVLPYQIKAGVNLRPTDVIEIGIDYRFWRFSVYTEQVTRLTATEDSEGMALMLDGQEIVLPQYMKDSHNLCAGTRVALRRSPIPLWLMAGVRYDWSPGEEMYFSLEMPYADAYGLSLGFAVRPLPWLEVGFAGTHDRFVEIDITESEAYPPAKLRASIHNTQYQLSVQASF